MTSVDDAALEYYLRSIGKSAAAGYSAVAPAVSTPQTAGSFQTQFGIGNSTAAPATNSTLATVTVASAGYYRVRATYGYGATAESTAVDNFKLAINAGTLTNLIAPIANANTLYPPVEFWLPLNAADVVKLMTDGSAGSAGSLYKGFLVVDRMN